jgi:transmembrane sensor
VRISGVFPLDDTERVLQAVARTLPVRLHYRTRYWVSVEPA